jgi:hypothetical protein
MAITGPKYEQSAVDIISPMLNINRQLAEENRQNYDRLMAGVKGGAEGMGGWIASEKREDAVNFKGDDYVADLRRKIAAKESELQRVKSEMEMIEKAGSQEALAAALPTNEAMAATGAEDMSEYKPNTAVPNYSAMLSKRQVPGAIAMGGL